MVSLLSGRQAAGGGPEGREDDGRLIETLVALIAPWILVVALFMLGGPEEARWLLDAPAVGPPVTLLVRAVTWLYTLDLQVGLVEPAFVGLGLYLVETVFFLTRRRYVQAAWVFVLPLLACWFLAATLLQD